MQHKPMSKTLESGQKAILCSVVRLHDSIHEVHNSTKCAVAGLGALPSAYLFLKS